jgi:hypothetical protein
MDGNVKHSPGSPLDMSNSRYKAGFEEAKFGKKARTYVVELLVEHNHSDGQNYNTDVNIYTYTTPLDRSSET